MAQARTQLRPDCLAASSAESARSSNANSVGGALGEAVYGAAVVGDGARREG